MPRDDNPISFTPTAPWPVSNPNQWPTVYCVRCGDALFPVYLKTQPPQLIGHYCTNEDCINLGLLTTAHRTE